MIIDLQEARDYLRIDGDYNDDIIEPLIEAIPGYLEVSTGVAWDEGEVTHPLAKTTAKFVLQLWFDPQTEDSIRLKRTIDTLLVSLTAIGRAKNG
ncbi:head-tail connector protein [Salinicoccus sp. Marseille-QA3877]